MQLSSSEATVKIYGVTPEDVTAFMLTEGQIDSTLVFPGVWVLLCVAEIVVMRTLLEMV